MVRFLCLALLLVTVPTTLTADRRADKRSKIDERSSKILGQVLEESAKARKLYGRAIGYAVFDNTKVAFGLAGEGGSGVAVDKSSGRRTYMKMASGGVGLGLGVKTYQVIMLFENKNVFDNFVDNGWQADTQAGAAAGTAGAGAEATFHDGMAVLVRTKKGLIASADISATKYWRSDLND